MDWILDQSLVDLGIETVVIGVAKQVDPQAPLSATFLAKKKEKEAWALNCDLSSVKEEAVVQGYMDLLKEVGRSVKKNPPTILALIKNIQSTHPVRGATAHAAGMDLRKPNFNPRTPCGVRLLSNIGDGAIKLFQSTHPVRGATWRCSGARSRWR